MWLTRLVIARPLAVMAIFLAVVVVGLATYLSLPINLFPNINVPIVTISTVYPGAGPEEVELQVTANIEDAVAGLSDIDTITSVSAESVSSVVVTFTDRANNDLIASAVERQVSSAIGKLPQAADRPVVTKLDPNAQPVMQIAVVGDRLAPEDLFDVADQTVRPQFERLTGVSQVTVIGGRQREVRIEVDPQKLSTAGVSLTQVQSALAASNVSTPAGSVPERGREYTLRVAGQFARPEDFGRVVVGGTTDNPVRLRDVASVRLTAREASQITRVNGRQGVLLRVGKQNGSNTTDVADAVQAALPGLRAQLPAGAELIVIQDTSQFVRQSIGGVRTELITAVILTSIILFLFLHSPRIAFIVLLSIPTTLLGALIAMSFLGFTLNFLSMLGLTLSIGILVDDSIVILESILRRLEAGDEPTQAAINGRAQIGLAAIAITLVDVVIFAPVGLVRGQVGGFFREFGFTIAATTLLSLAVSFTLTPLLASRLVRLKEGTGWLTRFGHAWDRRFERFENRYRRVLYWSLHHRLPTLLGASLTLIFGVGLLATGRVGTEFFPQNDQGFITVSSQAPPGTSLDGHDAAMRKIEAALMQVPEIRTITASVGASSGFGGLGGGGQARNGNVTVELTPKPRRTAFVIATELRQRLLDVPGVTVRVDVQGAGGGGQPVQLRLQGPDEATLARVGDQVVGVLKGIPGLRDLNNSAAVGLPEIRIAVDRGRAEDLGITPQALGGAVRTAYGGVIATKYHQLTGKDLDVRLILMPSARLNVGSIGDLPIQTPGGQSVRLREVATLSEVSGPTQIDRRNQRRIVTVGANLDEGVVLGSVTPQINAAIARMQLPVGYTVQQGGNAEQQATAFLQLGLALGASIMLAYLLMAVLYDSLVYPLVILFALPVAVGGAIGGLWVFHYSFSLFAMIGMILLVGLAVKNGILLVDRTNHNRKNGMAREDALLEAGPIRLRPILMTSLTIAMALTPTALALGEGSELRAPLAAAVLGGVISSTALTLVVVPVMYTLLDSLESGVGRLAHWRPGRARAALRPIAGATDPPQESPR